MKKKIYVCPKCGRALNFSNNPEYTFACIDCEEDFYMHEVKEIEQPRMEGVVDYTELSKAYAQVKEITDSAIKVNNKFIEVKGKDILEQIAEYINETLRPIFDTGMHRDLRFKESATIYTSGLRLVFSEQYIGDRKYQAYFMCNGNKYIYFNTDHEYCYGPGCGRKFPGERSEGTDSLPLQVHGQYDDSDAEATVWGIFHPIGGNPDFQ